MTDRLTALDRAIADIAPHVGAWIGLLEAYVATLPPDTPPSAEEEGSSERSYAEHELAAMRRDLAALLALSR